LQECTVWESESNITTHFASWVAGFVIVVLALTAPAMAAADDDGITGAAGAPTTGTSSKQIRPTESSSELNALDLNVYGLSYHADREAADRLHLDNEVNPGLGLHYEFSNAERGIAFAEVATFYDSGSNWAKLAALGYQFKFGKRWKIGGGLAVMKSRTYNDGEAFICAAPLITYDIGHIKLNAVYFPKYEPYNEVNTFGFYISIPLRKRSQE